MAVCDTASTDYQCPHCDGVIRMTTLYYYDGGVSPQEPEHISGLDAITLLETRRPLPEPKGFGSIAPEAVRSAVQHAAKAQGSE